MHSQTQVFFFLHVNILFFFFFIKTQLSKMHPFYLFKRISNLIHGTHSMISGDGQKKVSMKWKISICTLLILLWKIHMSIISFSFDLIIFSRDVISSDENDFWWLDFSLVMYASLLQSFNPLKPRPFLTNDQGCQVCTTKPA